VRITYDPAKRAKTLAERELDFEDAAEVFAGPVLTARDDRWDYGEERYRNVRLSTRAHGACGLDAARRGPARDVDEEVQ
jgi:uncharacterized DUF497 family protein